ncbi:hypothetical protein B0H14DRAFT_2615390 [Mycena olivaceomarginata]|nr:hypothetical protein B0H14DRAFT_2615390 [Mycena olivaceomarginata]
MVYGRRAKPDLEIASDRWAMERVFPGAFIVASKYLNDSTMKNMPWALCTAEMGFFSTVWLGLEGTHEGRILGTEDMSGMEDYSIFLENKGEIGNSIPKTAPKATLAVPDDA